MRGKTILLISPEAWGTNFVSKHHYANYLAKHNTVYFLNPPTSYTKNPFGSVSCKTRVVKHGLVIVNYINLLPRLNALPNWLRKKTYARQARQLQEKLGIEQFDIVWSFDPNRFYDQHAWKADKRIYHTVDVHSNESFEEEIAGSSEIVLASSDLLIPKLKSYNQEIFSIGHATDLDHFQTELQERIQLPGKNTIKAGLIANFNLNNDYDLMKDLAEINPTIDFIFVGPYQSNNLGKIDAHVVSKVEELSRFDNVFFIGSRPAENLIAYLASFNINLVLYREDKRNIIINPHKMMGYFYAGNVTVSSWIDAYKDADANLIQLSDNNSDIPKLVHEISQNLDRHNSPELKAKRRAFAERNSYDLKIEEISKLLYD